MRRTLIFLALCLSLSGMAQVPVCMGGDLDHLNTVERRACNDEVRLVGEATTATNLQADYHLVVVCGEEGWKEYAAFSGRSETELSAAFVDTDVSTRTIFLRGTGITSSETAVALLTRSLPKPAGEGILLAQR